MLVVVAGGFGTVARVEGGVGVGIDLAGGAGIGIVGGKAVVVRRCPVRIVVLGVVLVLVLVGAGNAGLRRRVVGIQRQLGFSSPMSFSSDNGGSSSRRLSPK